MGSSPSRGIQPIFSEEYVEREKILRCMFPFVATFKFLLCYELITGGLVEGEYHVHVQISKKHHVQCIL